jgi:metallo-beta-lactamase class B
MNRIIGMMAGIAVMAMPVAARPQADDPLLRPVMADAAKKWLTPQSPRRIFGNTYVVGFGGLNVGLIRTSAGLILIDGALPQGVRDIEAHIRQLGLDPKDIKFILSTEPHADHASGIAALARDTGATVVASAWASRVLMAGHTAPDDPQAAWLEDYPAIRDVRVMRDREQIRLGDVAVTAHATPGHTPGSMSWSWRSCEGRNCVNAVFASSLNPIAADGWRFSDPAHASVIASFHRSYATMRALPCGLLLTAHPDQSGGDVKFARLAAGAKSNPFLDPGACRAYAAASEKALNERLATERAGKS